VDILRHFSDAGEDLRRRGGVWRFRFCHNSHYVC
jgi:hypothetical protein